LFYFSSKLFCQSQFFDSKQHANLIYDKLVKDGYLLYVFKNHIVKQPFLGVRFLIGRKIWKEKSVLLKSKFTQMCDYYFSLFQEFEQSVKTINPLS